MFRHAGIAILLACALGADDALAQAPRAPQGPAVRAKVDPAVDARNKREAGRQYVENVLRKYGEITDSATVTLVGRTLGRIVESAQIPGLRLSWTVSGNPSFGAFAIHGPYMVVNIGLIRAFEEIAARQFPTDARAREKRVEAYLAFVLAHETAHITLGHVASYSGGLPKPKSARDVEGRLGNVKEQAALRQQRAQEAAADTIGALYLLRAGYTIQDAIDITSALDTLGGPDCDAITLLCDHARWQERAAVLEVFRSYLKLDQTRFDDALFLIRSGVELPRAVALLDTVLTHFPSFPAALHARGAALMLQWLELTPIDSLRLQPSVPVYRARFAEAIRGGERRGPSASLLLARTRSALRAAAAKGGLPYSLSALSLLEAYAGSMTAAKALADSALAADPNDAELLNNFAIVRYLSGDRSGAVGALQRALKQSSRTTVAAPLFNMGRVQLELGNLDEARTALEAFTSLNTGSDWMPVAQSLLRRTTATGAAAGRAPSADAKATSGVPLAPPAVSGVELDMPASTAIGVLGSPEETRPAGDQGRILRWTSRGLSLLIAADGTVRAILLSRPAAGAVDGIRVGDAMQQVLAKWGRPTSGGAGEYAYARGSWMLEVSITDDRVRELMLVRNN